MFHFFGEKKFEVQSTHKTKYRTDALTAILTTDSCLSSTVPSARPKQ